MRAIEIQISENVAAAFARVEAGLTDMTVPLQQIAAAGVASTDDNFAGQHDPLGVPWAITKRKQQDSSARILFMSGDLQNSVIGRGFADYAEWGPEASGGAGIYAVLQQFGGTIRAKAAKALRTPFGPRASVTLPARAYVGFNDALEQLTLQVLGDFMIDNFGGDGAVQ
jgi:phage gpG-like protein